MLECYKVMILTKGNDLKRRTLGDRDKKLISHLEVLEIKNGAKEVREGVATEEEDLGELPCSP
jgi:hypothetical protein